MTSTLGLSPIDSRRLRSLYAVTGIEHRYSVLPDYQTECKARALFPDTTDLEPFPTTGKRMAVYQKYAPMSSATVLFVLKSLMSQLNPGAIGERVLNFGFGPGLTLEAMLLSVAGPFDNQSGH